MLDAATPGEAVTGWPNLHVVSLEEGRLVQEGASTQFNASAPCGQAVNSLDQLRRGQAAPRGPIGCVRAEGASEAVQGQLGGSLSDSQADGCGQCQELAVPQS